MDIGSALDTYMNFCQRQGDWGPFVFMGGVFTASGGLFALGSVPFYLRDKFNKRSMEKVCAKLDERPSMIFNIKAGEGLKGAHGYVFKVANKSADKLHEKVGNRWIYDDERECAEKHASYRRHTYSSPMIISTGKTTSIIPRTVTEFLPTVVAVQYIDEAPEVAAPIFSGPKSNTGWRIDGRQMQLN